MLKCDVVIPVYKSPEWVKLCVYSLFKNTSSEILNKVFLVNDCNDDYTINCLENLRNKYGSKIELIQNKDNLGFIGSTNKGLKASTADYVLLLNTDCIISNRTIEKMINNIKNDDSIGLVCPISSNAANLTLEMFPGFSYNDMNSLLEKKFSGMLFDACTIVGNCLMITKKCLKEVGFLDSAYGMGYGEETDYQFSAMEKGFKAKVSIDTYVFHKSEASFGTSKEKQQRLEANRKLFFSRWEKQYNKEYNKYLKNDPIKYVNDNLSEADKIPSINNCFYLNGIVQNAGGVHVVVDMVNYMAINGQSANVIYDIMGDYKEIMLFNPICSNKIDDIKIKNIISTVWLTTFAAYNISKKKKCNLLYFVQGYEGYFENGGIYGIVETSYKLSDSILTISSSLKKELKDNFDLDSYLINNGINLDLIKKKNTHKVPKDITFIMRNNVMKGDWLIMDIIKKLDKVISGYNFNIVYMNEYIEFPEIVNNKLNKILGPLSRNDIIQLLQSSDIYVDTSLHEGFGLTPLEAMAAGNAVIVSSSFGINDYIINNKNGIIIEKVNDASSYVKAIISVVNNKGKYKSLLSESLKMCEDFDMDVVIDKYNEYFNKLKITKTAKSFTNKDKYLMNTIIKEKTVEVVKKRKIYYIAKFIPKWLKRRIKKVVLYLYGCFSH